MAEPSAKRFEHDVELHRDGRFGSDGEMVEVPENWTPEDSVLAGLLDCSLTSLRYHALRYGGFVQIDVHFNVSFAPSPSEQEIGELFAKAERDCFVGASLTPAPTYSWNVVE